MKTDDLIDMLGTNVEPVKSGQLRNAFFIALAVGAVAAFCLMLATLGLPAGCSLAPEYRWLPSWWRLCFRLDW